MSYYFVFTRTNVDKAPLVRSGCYQAGSAEEAAIKFAERAFGERQPIGSNEIVEVVLCEGQKYKVDMSPRAILVST